jgi:hypothetical protein
MPRIRVPDLPEEPDPLDLDRAEAAAEDQQPHDRRRLPQTDVGPVEDEEAEADEDEADGIGPRPV